jgi:hypothetical protein
LWGVRVRRERMAEHAKQSQLAPSAGWELRARHAKQSQFARGADER